MYNKLKRFHCPLREEQGIGPAWYECGELKMKAQNRFEAALLMLIHMVIFGNELKPGLFPGRHRRLYDFLRDQVKEFQCPGPEWLPDRLDPDESTTA